MCIGGLETIENLLVSAPTSVGKTNIAMLTVLREQQNNREGGVLCKDQFKVEHACSCWVKEGIFYRKPTIVSEHLIERFKICII